MDESQADRWIEILGQDLECAMMELEKMGEPGLRRLFQACERIVWVPPGGHWQDAAMNRASALGRLGKLYPELLLELVQGKKYLKMATIQGLGYTGDERLTTIAKAALKVFGDDL